MAKDVLWRVWSEKDDGGGRGAVIYSSRSTYGDFVFQGFWVLSRVFVGKLWPKE